MPQLGDLGLEGARVVAGLGHAEPVTWVETLAAASRATATVSSVIGARVDSDRMPIVTEAQRQDQALAVAPAGQGDVLGHRALGRDPVRCSTPMLGAPAGRAGRPQVGLVGVVAVADQHGHLDL